MDGIAPFRAAVGDPAGIANDLYADVDASAALVAGAIALLRASEPELTPADVAARIEALGGTLDIGQLVAP